MSADEKFLSRWSRRKSEARHPEETPPGPVAAPAPVAATAAPAAAGETPAVATVPPELPPVDSLKGLASEYAAFLKPGVDETLKRAALKKLFRDPYFETFEKFEAYCEDYTQGEAIPAAMLKTLEHAKGLLFDEKKEDEERAAERAGTRAPAQIEAKLDEPEKAKEDAPLRSQEKA